MLSIRSSTTSPRLGCLDTRVGNEHWRGATGWGTWRQSKTGTWPDGLALSAISQSTPESSR
eukprot:1284743-Pyramimonas_sp.AAC.1